MSGARFVARDLRSELVPRALLCALMIGAAIAMMFYAEHARRMDPFVLRIMLGFCAIYFSLVEVDLVTRLLAPGDRLDIGPDGILFRRWSDEGIPWDAIARVKVVRRRIESILSLSLVPGFQPRTKAVRGLLQRWASALGQGSLVLTTQATDRRFSELEAVMRSYVGDRFEG